MVADNKGWIKLHRSITECFLWNDKPYDKARAWIDILLMVRHSDKKMLVDGKLMEIKTGSYLISRGKLAERWGWGIKKVDSYLKLLEDEGMIAIQGTTKGIALTVVKYSDFQFGGTAEDTAEGTAQGTAQGIAQGIAEGIAEGIAQGTQNKNVKKEKNVKNEKKYSSEVSQVLERWNALTEYGVKAVSRLAVGTERYKMLLARIDQYGLEDVLSAIDRIKQSDFLQGRTSKWSITFDWFVKPNNFPKVLEGNYDNSNVSAFGYKESTTAKQIDDMEKFFLRELHEKSMANGGD